MPLFSIIIPTLNEEKYLPHLLASLVGQNQRYFEVIVVDGKSSDKTVVEAKKFTGKIKRLKILVSPKTNLPLQRNLGARRAVGEWLVFVDADSVLLDYFFERVQKYLAKYTPQLFTAWFRPDSEIASDAMLTLFTNILIEGSVLTHRFLSPGPLTFVTKKAFASIGGYDESRGFGEDYDLSQRLSEKGIKLQILRETLCILSLRRYRKQGTLKVLRIYIRGIFFVLLTKKQPKNIPGYIMGGHLYGQEKNSDRKSVLKTFETKIKKLITELIK